MILLVPKWAYNYDEFWITIRRRNLWFIKLRYVAAVTLILFLIISQYLLNLEFDHVQVQAISIIALSLFTYNITIHIVRPKVSINPDKFNAMHLSLIQMVLDLTALLLLVYYTGTIDSPIYVFFIFHMVIGSLILPGVLIYTICGIVIVMYSLFIFLQQVDIFRSHYIAGLYDQIPQHNLNYVIMFVLMFAAMMIVTVILANRIASNLLKREGELRETLDKIQEIETAKQKYIMGVVHEIKTPIAAVKSLIDLIVQKFIGPVSAEVEEKLLRAKGRCEEALDLINDVLRISRLKLLQSTEKQRVFLIDLINQAILERQEAFNAKNIEVEVIDYREKKKPVFGDKDLLYLAISNLISNEAKYVNENGHVKIEISEHKELVCIKIIDDGIGIPWKDIDKVFEQFYRASNIKKQKTEGSGLGLSIVKEIIDHHDGEIKVESPSPIGNAESPGTLFIIHIPFMKEDTEKTETVTLLDGL